jgi:2-keto-4-pentenoate hydratase
MNATTLREAADCLWSTWQARQIIDELPAAIRPSSRAQGYAIQSLLEQRTTEPLFGWKIAATAVAGQRHIGVDRPLAGRLLAERVRTDGAAIGLAGNRMRVAECEFAFRLARGLEPRPQGYVVAEVMAAVATLHPAIEIPDSRYRAFEKVGAAQLIADNACADLFILGAAATCNWRALDLPGLAVTATVNHLGDAPQHHHGLGADVLGDPRVALTWLVNELSGLGVPLKAREVVTTGTCVTPIAVTPGDELRATFGPVGEVSARFTR